MVLGEELHTGGVPLETDILVKRINFIKTLGEQIQLTGDRIIRAGAVQAGSSTTIYTVPENRLLFLFFFTYSSINRGTATGRTFFFDLAGETILEFNSPANTSISDVVMFRPMFLLRAGETIIIRKNNTNTDHEVNIRSTGYEVSGDISAYSEASIQ